MDERKGKDASGQKDADEGVPRTSNETGEQAARRSEESAVVASAADLNDDNAAKEEHTPDGDVQEVMNMKRDDVEGRKEGDETEGLQNLAEQEAAGQVKESSTGEGEQVVDVLIAKQSPHVQERQDSGLNAEGQEEQAKEGRATRTPSPVSKPSASTKEAEEHLEARDSNDRDLPAPPTPAKESLPLSTENEMANVARAFGVQAVVHEDDEGTNARPSQQSTSAAPKSTDGIGLSTTSEHEKDTPHAVTSATPASTRGGGLRIGKGPPPTTQASEEKPFDFNRFLDQMRHRSAGPVGEYVRSFIKGFTKKPYRVADQTKLILDFLDFIALRMRECEVWATLSQGEFDNSMEAMEKLIMNRLYNFTFSPAIKREGKWSVQTDDLERDRVLKQRIRLFGWIDESHLDVPMGDHSKGFIDFAIQELLKINHYKAPRDKVICILNCCKVIFGLIRHLSTQENADTFVPILIFVVLRANPDNLISNVEYISRFRNPERLSSESGYYLSSLMGAVAFIETMDYTSLSNITQQEFEANVEAAIVGISAQGDVIDQLSPARMESGHGSKGGEEERRAGVGRNGYPQQASGLDSAQMTPQGSISSNEDGSNRALPISTGATALAKDTRAFIARTGEAARVGIGASFGGGMSALGRLFQDGLDGPRTPLGSSPSATGTGGAASGYVTPEGSVGQHQAGQPSSGTARSRMWNLFGVDEDQIKDQKAIRQKDGNGAAARSTSGPTLNFGSWGRNMRPDADSEPPTPQSEELRQGRFTSLTSSGSNGQLTAQPLSERLAKSFESRSPRTPAPPIRRESTDPYLIDETERGVQTPTDDGSETGHGGDVLPTRLAPGAGESGMTRARQSDLSSYLPSFLQDVGLVRTPQGSDSPLPPHAMLSSDNVRNRGALGSPMPELNDEQAAHATAQIDRAHLDAGVDTLKSIFPDTESSVCRLVLEGCGGDVQASIDKLLEMT